MRFTMSKDGRHRATLRIEFRVDSGYLESAVAELLVARMLDDPNVPANPTDDQLEYMMEDHADRVSAHAAVAALRRELQRRGYSDHGLDDDWHEAASRAAERRCRELFPAAYRDIGAALVERSS